MEEQQEKELIEIIKRLEEIGKTMHEYSARHIDEAIYQLEYYLPQNYQKKIQKN